MNKNECQNAEWRRTLIFHSTEYILQSAPPPQPHQSDWYRSLPLALHYTTHVHRLTSVTAPVFPTYRQRWRRIVYDRCPHFSWIVYFVCFASWVRAARNTSWHSFVLLHTQLSQYFRWPYHSFLLVPPRERERKKNIRKPRENWWQCGIEMHNSTERRQKMFLLQISMWQTSKLFFWWFSPSAIHSLSTIMIFLYSDGRRTYYDANVLIVLSQRIQFAQLRSRAQVIIQRHHWLLCVAHWHENIHQSKQRPSMLRPMLRAADLFPLPLHLEIVGYSNWINENLKIENWWMRFDLWIRNILEDPLPLMYGAWIKKKFADYSMIRINWMSRWPFY